jgi:hypothetical protein
MQGPALGRGRVAAKACAMIIQSIDPGKPKRKHLGRALFENRQLTRCGIWDLFTPAWACTACRIEKPIIYPRSPVPPNDILELAIDAGRAAQAVGWECVRWVLPRTWKGTQDAEIFLPRVIATLTDTERRVYFGTADRLAVSYHEHVICAIGIGLWHLGRPFAP